MMSDHGDDALSGEDTLVPPQKVQAQSQSQSRPMSYPASHPRAHPAPRPVSRPMTEPAPEGDYGSGDESDSELNGKKKSDKSESDDKDEKAPEVEPIDLLTVESARDEPQRKLRGLAYLAKPKGAETYVAGYCENIIKCDKVPVLPKSTLPTDEEHLEQQETLRHRTPIASPEAMAAFVAQAEVMTNRQSMAAPSKMQRPNSMALAAFAAENRAIQVKNAAMKKKGVNITGEEDSQDGEDKREPPSINTVVTNHLTDVSGRLSHALVFVGGQPNDEFNTKALLLFFLRCLTFQVDSLLRMVITCNTPKGVPYSDSIITWALDVAGRCTNVSKLYIIPTRPGAQELDCAASLEETFNNMDYFITDIEIGIREAKGGNWNPFPGTASAYIRDSMKELRPPLYSLVNLIADNEDWAIQEGGPQAANEAKKLGFLRERVQDSINAIDELVSRRAPDWANADYKYVNWTAWMGIDYYKIHRMVGSLEQFGDNAVANQPVDNGDDPDWALIKHQYILQMLDESNLEPLIEMLDWMERRFVTTHGPREQGKMDKAVEKAGEARQRAIETRERGGPILMPDIQSAAL